MYSMSKLVALILAFCLGFSMAGGIIVGGAAVALGSFRVRDLEKHGIVEIPDEMFMGENPEKDLLNLSAFEMIDELKELKSLGNEVTINFLQKRYDLKIDDKLNIILTDDVRNMPIKQVFSKDGIDVILASVYIGYAQSFECHYEDSNEKADPALGKELTRWYNPNTGRYVSGIQDTLSYITIHDFTSGKVDVHAIVGDLVIADVLGYYREVDEFGNETWYDSNGNVVTGIMTVFAGCTVDEIGTKIDTTPIGDLLGYKCTIDENGNESWTDSNGDPVTGVMAVFAGYPINEVGTQVNSAKIGELLGYQLKDGVWYNGEEPVSGIMKVLADSTMDTVGDTIEGSLLGDLLGYECVDGVWYDGEEPLTGIMKVLAPSTMDNVGEKIETALLGDLLGYEKRDGVWYNGEEEVTGMMKVLADATMDTVGDKLETALLGDLLGYEMRDGVWYNGEEEVTGMMKVLADATMDTVGDKLETALLGDLLGYEKRDGVWYNGEDPVTGIMKVIADSKMDNVGDVIEDSKLGDLLGYQLIGGEWYEDVGGTLEPVSGFMDKIADEKMDSLGNAFDNLTIGDIVEEEDRNGIFAILSPDTSINNIATEINDSIMNSPLQFFMNEGLVTFDDDTRDFLDGICYTIGGEKIVYLHQDSDEFKDYYDGNGYWIKVGEYYQIPGWRTVPLNESFSYIIGLLATP